MPPIRILIVDDSAVIRSVVSQLLASDPEIVVAGTASDGDQALLRIAEVKPDLVTLDIEMPGMDGLQALVEIRRLYPKLPVIMFSSLTERGAASTLDALSRGASDYVPKPSHLETTERSRARVREELLHKIKSLCRGNPLQQPPAVPASTTSPFAAQVSIRPQARVEILAIGSSTGEPTALSSVLAQLPSDFPVPIVI